MRAPLALLAGAAVALIAAAVLGEYSFEGWAVVASGLLVGLFVAEAMMAVAGHGTALTATGAALLAAGSLVGAGWTATGHRLGTVGWKGWAAVALAASAGAIRARPHAAARRSPPAPAAPE